MQILQGSRQANSRFGINDLLSCSCLISAEVRARLALDFDILLFRENNDSIGGRAGAFNALDEKARRPVAIRCPQFVGAPELMEGGIRVAISESRKSAMIAGNPFRLGLLDDRAQQFVHRDRFVAALDDEIADEPGPELGRDKYPRLAAQQDVRTQRFGDPLEAGREIHRIPDQGIIDPFLAADVTGNHLAEMQANARAMFVALDVEFVVLE